MGRNLLDVIAGVVWLGFALSHATAQVKAWAEASNSRISAASTSTAT